MYEYQTPDGYGDIFYIYVFDANEAALAESATYNMLGVQVTDGEFVVRNWTGAYTLLQQTPTLGACQIYSPNLRKWFQTPVSVFTLNPSLQSTSIPLIEEKLYPINGNLRFDLIGTSLRFNNAGGVSYGTQVVPAAPSAQMAFFGTRRIQGYQSDPQGPDDGKVYSEKAHQIPFAFTMTQKYGGGSILSQYTQYQVPVKDYDFELRDITKFCYTVGGGSHSDNTDEVGNGVRFTAISASNVNINIPDVSGTPNLTLSVVVVGNTITINVATDAGGVISSTNNQVHAALVASVPASALISSAVLGSGTFIMTVPFSTFLIGGGGNAPTPLPSPFAITLYDGNKQARSNFPVLAEFLIDDTVTPTGRNHWPCPPIKYRVNTVIQFDVFTLLSSDFATPLFVSLLFNGVWRIPCQ